MQLHPKIRIQNVVTSFSFKSPLDLSRIRKAFRKKCFFDTLNDRRYTFRVVALRSKKPRCTFLIYSTGKIVCTGSKTLENAKRSAKYLLGQFQKAGITAQLKTKVKIQNIVATTTLKKPIDIEELLTRTQKRKQIHVIYEPDHDKEATILMFSSGKLVCVGLTDFEQVRSAIRTIESALYGKNYL